VARPKIALSRVFSSAFSAFLLLLSLTGCTRSDSGLLQGYVEGEFVYVASPLGGALESLRVQRGAWVKAGDPLFALDSAPERALRDDAAGRLLQARANLEDAKKGKRPSEIESLEEQLKQAQAALAYSEKELARQQNLIKSGATPLQEHERSYSRRDQDRHRVAQLQADLVTARLGSRSDQIAAAAATVEALVGTLAKAEWDLSQKSQAAPKDGLVFDTLYREGEWVGAARPVVVLLPPQNVKVRAFVPERQIGAIQPGERVQVFVDGVPKPFAGKVSYISPRAEYTPPVIYSQENRAKLVFMVEAVFDPEAAAKLHPGQPVDLRFGS
jgi:HlyD family secretion protein